jgi:hypothetical protein
MTRPLLLLTLLAACGGSTSATTEDSLHAGNGVVKMKHYCTPWQSRCVDEYTSATCAPDGNSDLRVQDCWAEYQTKCSPATGQCDVCEPNSFQCLDSVTATQCNPYGTGSDYGIDCAGSGFGACVPATGKCGCVPNQWGCEFYNEGVAGLCNATGDGFIDEYDCAAVGKYCLDGACRAY